MLKFPSIEFLACSLRELKGYIEPPTDGDDESGWINVRLQVHETGWTVHSGDASYDQDHRGAWGSSSLSRRSNCRDVARDLIEQAREQIVWSE